MRGFLLVVLPLLLSMFFQTIPQKFVQQHLTKAGACLSSQNAIIVCTLGKFWRVKLHHGLSDVLCGDEWPQFVTAHGLSQGNILLFRYEGTNMVFSVEVFLRNGCLKEYHTTLALCITDGARGPSATFPQSKALSKCLCEVLVNFHMNILPTDP
jgi:hypothetical protein